MVRSLRVPRRRGALSGALLILLGAWGGLIAFVGPYFHYAYTPDQAWAYTSGRLWLEILPGIGAAIGGLVLLASTLRPVAILGAWIAALSGAWFAVGSVLVPLWAHQVGAVQGVPVGGAVTRALEQLGFFTGLGIVIVFVASIALGQLTVRAARDVRALASGQPVTPPSSTPKSLTPAGATPGNAAPAGAAPGSKATVRMPGAAMLRRVATGKAGKEQPTQLADTERTEPASSRS